MVCEVRPRYVFVENSPMLTIRGLGAVLGDLAEMGYDARWGVFSAADVGAQHLRERIWILAYANGDGLEGRLPQAGFSLSKLMPASSFARQVGRRLEIESPTPPILRRSNDLADSMDRLRAIGNGQVPSVAALAWRILSEGII